MQTVDAIAIITLFLSRLSKAKLLPKICALLEQVYNLLDDHPERTTLRLQRKVLASIVVTVLFALYVNLYIFAVEYIDRGSTKIWFRLVFSISKFIFAMAICFAHCLLITLLTMWKGIRDMLSNVKSREMNVILDLHQSIYQTTQIVGKFLGPIFLSVYAAIFTTTTISLYYFYRILKGFFNRGTEQHTSQMMKSLMMNVNLIVLNVVLVVVVTFVSEKIIKVSRQVDEMIHDFSLEQKQPKSVEVIFFKLILIT